MASPPAAYGPGYWSAKRASRRIRPLRGVPVRKGCPARQTGEGTPGSGYRYNGDRFGLIDRVIAAAAGLISSVTDYATFDIAADEHRFLSESTQALTWTPFRSTSGRRLPYGYGWFTQTWKGLKVIWHYGYWSGTSTLIVRVPERLERS